MDTMAIDDPRGPIDYAETGIGPTLVLVPGSCSTGAAWRAVMPGWDGDIPMRDDEPSRIWPDGRAPDRAGSLNRP